MTPNTILDILSTFQLKSSFSILKEGKKKTSNSVNDVTVISKNICKSQDILALEYLRHVESMLLICIWRHKHFKVLVSKCLFWKEFSLINRSAECPNFDVANPINPALTSR